MNKKTVVLSVTNDLVTDQRVKRSIAVLMDAGYEVTLVGRCLITSLPIHEDYKTVRFKLWFNSGFLFYANYNLRLFFFLLFKNFDLFFSNDLDTLLPNYILSKIKGKPIVYDSHEYFLGVPEIQDRPVVKSVWRFVEKLCLPRTTGFITVNESIRELYHNDYKKNAVVVRNISTAAVPSKVRSRKELGLPEDKFLFINQGSGINVERGMEEFIDALEEMSDCALVLVGKGDVYPLIEKEVKSRGMDDKVIFISPKPYLEMLEYTINSDCGISLDKGSNLNYQYSLPNKLFDYIKAGIPILSSSVIEVKNIVKNYGIGEVIEDHSKEEIIKCAQEIRGKDKDFYKANLFIAKEQNNWHMERLKLRYLVDEIEQR